MKSIKKFLDKVILNVTTILFMLMVLIVFMQVIFRYMFHNSLSWSEELSRYILIWIIFLGSGYVLGERGHVNLDALFCQFPKKIRFILTKINAILLFGYSYLMVRYGIELMIIGLKQKSSAMQIPMYFIYIALPLGGLFIMFYCIYIFLDKGESK